MIAVRQRNVLCALFRQEGLIVVRGLLSPQHIAKLKCGLKRHYAGERDRSLENIGKHCLDFSPNNGRQKFGLSDFIAHFNNEVREVLLGGRIGSVARGVLSAKRVRLFQSSVVYKAASSSNRPDELAHVAWHCDNSFWPNCSSKDLVTAWVPLEPVSKVEGSLFYIPGSHRLSETRFHRKKFLISSASWESELELINSELGEVRYVELAPGDVSFHHSNLLHCGGPNLGTKDRRTVIFHIQPEANEYCASGSEYSLDRHVQKNKTGYPDYWDPVMCPEL